MITVSILVLESAVMEALTNPRALFSAANQFLIAEGKEPLFRIEMVGIKREVPQLTGLVTVHTDKLLDEVTQTDMVFIPAISGDVKDTIRKNKEFLPWITKQYQNGAEIASLCIGAFMLASTGLLNGKQCSTHWLFANEFRSMFPDVNLVDGSIISEENGIYSSGGANSYWNLLLYLLEKFTDREMAIRVAKYFAIDIDRDNQSKFMIFEGQRNHNDEAVKAAQEIIEKNIEERLSVEELASKVAVGRRTFERRFKQATNNSVLEYIHRVKIEAAKRRFENTRNNINEVMYDVGYTDVKAFRTTFKKITGLTPVAYRNKYSKATA